MDYSSLLSDVREEMADSTLPTTRLERAIAAVEQDLNANPRFIVSGLKRRVGSLAMTADNQYSDAPSDLKKPSKIILTGTTPQGVLRFYPSIQFDMLFSDSSATGQPTGYTLIDEEIKWGDKPDAAYVYEITYYSLIQTTGAGTKPDDQKPLTSSNTTNWITVNYPDIYFYGVITDMLPYVGQEDRARLSGSPTRYQRVVDGIVGVNSLLALGGDALFSQPVTPTP